MALLLWASLVEHILRKTADAVKILHDKILAEIGVQAQLQTDLQGQVNEKAKEIKTIAGTIEQKAGELVKTAEEIQAINARNILATVLKQPDVQGEIQKLNQLRDEIGLPKLEEGAADLQAAIAETQALTRRGTTLLMSLGRDKSPGRQIFWLALLLVAGPTIGWGVLKIGQHLTDTNNQLVSQTVAMLAAMNTWLIVLVSTIRQTSRWLSERMTTIEQVKQRWDARVAEAQSGARKELADLERRRAQIEADLLARQAQLAIAKEREQQLRDELKQATPLHLLAKFLHQRVESNDYQKYLGLLAIIRRDFEQMSQFIEGDNQSTLEFATLDEEKVGYDGRINRIVLYIDDLDRCPSDKVIQVLQAVHLLLAFPLFVVVVAVDARWIAGALRERYGDLLRADDAASTNGTPAAAYLVATPIDYPEKIFQIPFWLSPMSQKARQNLIAGILAGSIVDDAQLVEPAETVNSGADVVVRDQPVPDVGAIETIETADAVDLNPDALTTDEWA